MKYLRSWENETAYLEDLAEGVSERRVNSLKDTGDTKYDIHRVEWVKTTGTGKAYFISDVAVNYSQGFGAVLQVSGSNQWILTLGWRIAVNTNQFQFCFHPTNNNVTLDYGGGGAGGISSMSGRMYPNDLVMVDACPDTASGQMIVTNHNFSQDLTGYRRINIKTDSTSSRQPWIGTSNEGGTYRSHETIIHEAWVYNEAGEKVRHWFPVRVKNRPALKCILTGNIVFPTTASGGKVVYGSDLD